MRFINFKHAYKDYYQPCVPRFVLFTECSNFKTCKGSLFIIGGGHRSPALMKTLLAVSSLKTKDYIVVLPMASEETDTAFYYVKTSLVNLCSNTIANLDFSKHNKFDQQWLDSLLHAKLIFICGGDQSRLKNCKWETHKIQRC